MIARPNPTANRFGESAESTRRLVTPGCPVRVAYRTADIRHSSDWSVRSSDDTLIVHLGGRMDALETEIDGRGSSRGPAVIGEIWTVPAGVRYHSAMKGDSIQFAVLTFSLVHATAGRLALRAGHWDGELLSSLRSLHAAIRARDDAGDLDASAATFAVWESIVRNHSSTMSGQDRRPTDRLSGRQADLIRDFVNENLGSRVRLSLLSQLVDMSSHQFLVAFRQAFGTSPGQYIITQRLRAARRLLLSTRDDVTTIALRCGFSSHSHMTSAFSTRMGITPSSFRRLMG